MYIGWYALTYTHANTDKCILYMYVSTLTVVPVPRILLKPSNLQQGIVGEALDLICLISLSSTVQTVNLTWNFTSNDNRITVIPTTITTNNSIDITYTTVIRFAYLLEQDEANYTCIFTIGRESVESTFNLEIISKYDLLQI